LKERRQDNEHTKKDLYFEPIPKNIPAIASGMGALSAHPIEENRQKERYKVATKGING
jgi:hypothetical protein